MLHNHFQSGGKMDGFIKMIRVAGFNGTVDIIWDAEVMTTKDRLNDGLA